MNHFSVAAVFEESPAPVTAEVGSNVSLQCIAEGYPPPTTVQWLHYDTVIGETDSITIDEVTVNSTTVVSTLELSGLSTVQYGQYQCRANGDVDSEHAAISFTGTYTTPSPSCFSPLLIYAFLQLLLRIGIYTFAR